MNLLKLNPELLNKKIDSPIREYTYNCFDLLNEYDINIHIYINYLLSIEEFKLKNIWNHIIFRWNKMKLEMKDNLSIHESIYSKNEYHQIHDNMNDEILNDLFNQFIDYSHFKAIFILNCIQNYIYPN